MSAVYAISDRSAVKVGVAIDAHKRMRHLQTGHPKPLHLVYAVRVDDAGAVERGVHRRLADRRAFGEWFKASKRDVIAAINAEIDARGLTGESLSLDAPQRRTSRALDGLDNPLARYLIRHRLRPAWFAERLSVQPSYLHMLLTGQRGMSLALAARIVRETRREVSYDDLQTMHEAASAWRAEQRA